jgi:effector-binding domain-containing protein
MNTFSNPYEEPISKTVEEMKIYSCKFCGIQERHIHLNCPNVCNCLESMIEFNQNKFYIYNSKQKEKNGSNAQVLVTS